MPSPLAFISDIHGNLPALRAVLADIAEQGIGEIICLGDVVGYGGQPAECLELLRGSSITTLKGNHDAAVAGGPDAEDCGDGLLKLMWNWTQGVLSQGQRSWLAELPLTLRRPGIQAAHATLRQPAEWDYVLSAAHADLHFAYQDEPLCFIGHTHRPALWVAGEDALHSITGIQAITPGRMHLVNVGSVGQPRDRDPRACYALWRPDQHEIQWRRVSYDITAAQHAIEDAGLPVKFAERLSLGR